MSDFIERLRRPFTSTPTSSMNLMSDAADLIEAQQTEIARLREALGRLLSLAEVSDVMDEPGRPTVKLARAALEQKP